MNSEQLKKLMALLTPERREHTERVVSECRSLSKKFSLSETDTERLINAAYLHDITKRLKPTDHIALATAFGLKLDRSSPETMHQITGAEFARHEFPDLVDDEVYAAIANHTTGSPAMSKIEKLLFLADCIEPGRTHEACRQIRSQFYRMLKFTRPDDALDRAVADSLSFTIDYLEKNGLPIDKKTVSAQKYYSQPVDESEADESVLPSAFTDIINNAHKNQASLNKTDNAAYIPAEPEIIRSSEVPNDSSDNKGVKKKKMPRNARNTDGKKKKSKTVRILIFIISAILIIAALCAGYLLYNKYIYKPEGTTEPPRTDIDQTKIDKEITGCYNFLIVAKDRIAYNTDVIMVVNFNADNNSASIMQIPRDTYVYADGYGRKINSVFAHFYSGKTDEERVENGMKGLADTISKSMNITINEQIMIDLEGFVQIVDAIGGVPMYVPYDMKYSDPDQNLYIDLKEGQQTLDGDHAEQLVRFRKGLALADLGRGDAQKLFMTAFIKQVKESFNLTTVGPLAKTIQDYFMFSTSITDLLYYAQNALDIEMKDIVMFTAPGTSSTFNGGSYYVLHRYDMTNLLHKYFEINYVIDDKTFDHDKAFLASGSDKYYYADPVEDINEIIHSADDIDENGIDIALVKQ